LARELALSANALAVSIHELKVRHTRILQEVVADSLNVELATADGQRMVKDEMRMMLAVLTSFRQKSESPAPPRRRVKDRRVRVLPDC
jgi:hypothetical protein